MADEYGNGVVGPWNRKGEGAPDGFARLFGVPHAHAGTVTMNPGSIGLLAKSWKPKNLRNGYQIRIKGEEIVDLMVSDRVMQQ